MKNFPHQFNDLTKLYNALEVIQELAKQSIPLTDENFGEMLTRSEIYTYRDKSLTVEKYLANEKLKPLANRGYLTVARDIRRFFELLDFIEIDENKTVKLKPLAHRLLEEDSNDKKRELWKKGFLQLKLSSSDGRTSHPYLILLRLIENKKKIETAKLMLALEAEDDTEEEFNRILDLSERSIPEIIEYIGTTESMARNAVKILPGIAQQLGDIKRENDISVLIDENYLHPLDVEFERIEIEERGVEEESDEVQPFDPEKISIDTKSVTMDTILRRFEQNTLFLSPDFQRNEVWTEDQKCRLIESLMLKIPIPMFYISSDEQGNFSVVDGLQRLSTIRSFVLGNEYMKSSPKNSKFKGEGFKLQNLEFWGDNYNNCNFNQLPIFIQNRILESEFTFTIINPGTPEDLKRNVFNRINKGGAPLTSQEIRNALYTGESTKLLNKLSKKTEFLISTDFSITPTRMMDREIILRFLAFNVRNYQSYRNNNMDSFLSDTMRIINVMTDFSKKEILRILPDDASKKQIKVNQISELEALFIIAMVRAKEMFGKHTFRKSYGNNKKSPINKSLFEVWSVLLSQLTIEQYEILLTKKNEFLADYVTLFDNSDFVNSISRDSLKNQAVKYRFETLNELIKKYIV